MDTSISPRYNYAICGSWTCRSRDIVCLGDGSNLVRYILRDNDNPSTGWTVVMRFYTFFTSRAWHPTATRRRPTDGGEEKEKKAEGMRYTCGHEPAYSPRNKDATVRGRRKDTRGMLK